MKNPVPACALVIFGANGDLTKRLIVPALGNLTKAGLLPHPFALVGVGHSEGGVASWRDELHDFLESQGNPVDAGSWDRLAASMSYVKGDFCDAGTYERLRDHLAERDRKDGLDHNCLFYLAVPDRFFAPIVESLARVELTREGPGFRRVVVEKPFGHDLASAKELNARLLRCLDERQIFRIDHYLGKETVQNIMALRFANGLFEPVWNRDRIDHVQITVAESLGVEQRGKFYEATGALRDMVPSHLFQLVAMTAMEPPVSFEADAVRAKKAEVFRAIHALSPKDAVRGQYGSGAIGDERVPAYRREDNVDPRSFVETFAALRLSIDNWRWAGVPFYLRTGKRLAKRSTEIAIRFKDAPFALFRDGAVDALNDNWLVLQIQPEEGIRLRFNAKKPGPEMALESVAMDFRYGDWFNASPAVGYETLLRDCILGDQTLFQRADQVEASWAIVDPLLQAWSEPPRDAFPNYAAGSTGPESATALIARDGRAWRAIH